MEGRFSANLGGAVKFLKRAGFFFYCSKALYPIMFTIFFRASNHQILDWQKELKNWILFEFSRHPLENFTRSQKKKTVTFKDCILGNFGSNINDFHVPPHVSPSRWFNPALACPWRAVNVPSDFEFISYRNNLRRKLSIYFNKTRPYWIVIVKEDWLLCFRSNTIILNIVKFWAGA